MKLFFSRNWIIFAATCFLFLLSQFYKTSIAVITPQLMADLSLDTKGISLMSAVFFYTFALFQIPMGVYLDHIGPRITMTVLSLTAVVGVLIFAMSNSLAMSTFGRGLLGIGMAVNLMGSFKLVTLWFDPTKFATLSAVVVSVGTLGNIASTTPLVLLAKGMGWRHVFVLFAIITFLASIIFFLVVRDKPHETPFGSNPNNASKRLRNIFSDLHLLFQTKDYWIISMANFGRFGIFFAFQTLWAGPYLMQVMEFSQVNTGNIIFFLNLGFIVGGPIFGWLSDNILNTRKWIVVFGLIVLFFILFILAFLRQGTGFLVFAFLFFSFGLFGSSGLVMYAQIKEQMPLGMAGTAMAGINCFAFVGAAVFLHGMGHAMQHLYPQASFGPAAFRMVFLVCAAYIFGVTLLYVFTKDTKTNH
jgi:sugar phosphate permease